MNEGIVDEIREQQEDLVRAIEMAQINNLDRKQPPMTIELIQEDLRYQDQAMKRNQLTKEEIEEAKDQSQKMILKLRKLGKKVN